MINVLGAMLPRGDEDSPLEKMAFEKQPYASLLRPISSGLISKSGLWRSGATGVIIDR